MRAIDVKIVHRRRRPPGRCAKRRTIARVLIGLSCCADTSAAPGGHRERATPRGDHGAVAGLNLWIQVGEAEAAVHGARGDHLARREVQDARSDVDTTSTVPAGRVEARRGDPNLTRMARVGVEVHVG